MRNWVVHPPFPPELATESNLDPLLIQLLYNRGVTDAGAFETFIAGDDRLGHDPFLFPGIDRAVTRMQRALLGDELVAVYGDFDADGVTAAAVLTQGIAELGGRVIHYIPHRLDEGHGLNLPALMYLRKQGANLVITVDCGITGYAEAEEGKKLGLDLVITDHHVPLGPVPPALAALDPKMPGSPYPFRELAGVGVAFKLLQALFASTGRHGEWDKYLDLVALGTVADMVPLTGENRYLVKRGLEVLNRSCRVGILEMIKCAGLQPGKIDAQRMAYALAPRLNASGRLDHAVVSYELLVAESKERARELAMALETNNAERQRLTAESFADARQKVLAEGADLPLLMVSDHDCPPGVVGVVAGKLVDEFYRPSIVVSIDGDIARGSARSIRGFNIFEALCECRGLLTRFGGHAQAAGFQAPIANLEELRLRLLDVAGRELSGADLRPTLTIDVEIPLSRVSGDVYGLISRLAPFGQSNQAPVFLSRNVKVVSARTIGGNGDHLKLTLHDGRAVWDAIAFDHGKRELSSYIDAVYNLEVESWSGRELLRLNVLDFRPAS